MNKVESCAPNGLRIPLGIIYRVPETPWGICTLMEHQIIWCFCLALVILTHLVLWWRLKQTLNDFNLCSVPKHFPQFPLVCEQVKKSMFSVLTSLPMLSSMKECCIKKHQNRKNKRISSIKPDIFMRMIIWVLWRVIIDRSLLFILFKTNW